VTWYAFQGLNGGNAIDLAGIQEKDATAQGFHGYATESQAEANPNSVNVITRISADLLISDYKVALAGQGQPGGKNASNPVAFAAAADAAGVNNAAKYAANTIPGVAQIGDFFSALGQANTWIRVGEAVLGLILLAVGISKLTNAVPIATKVASYVR